MDTRTLAIKHMYNVKSMHNHLTHKYRLAHGHPVQCYNCRVWLHAGRCVRVRERCPSSSLILYKAQTGWNTSFLTKAKEFHTKRVSDTSKNTSKHISHTSNSLKCRSNITKTHHTHLTNASRTHQIRWDAFKIQQKHISHTSNSQMQAAGVQHNLDCRHGPWRWKNRGVDELSLIHISEPTRPY